MTATLAIRPFISLYFCTESNIDARLICYDLRAAAKQREDGRAKP